MFEFHGWAVIEVADVEDRAEQETQRERAKDFVRNCIQEAQDGFCHFNLVEGGNGLTVLSVHGLRNHWRENAIMLFKRVAAELPASYGVLYVNDAESEQHNNSFRIYRMARGNIEEFADHLLSPRIPTIEDPYYPEQLSELEDDQRERDNESGAHA